MLNSETTNTKSEESGFAILIMTSDARGKVKYTEQTRIINYGSYDNVLYSYSQQGGQDLVFPLAVRPGTSGSLGGSITYNCVQQKQK